MTATTDFRTLQLATCRYFSFPLVCILVNILLFGTQQAEADTNELSADAVIRAWENRPSQVSSFEYNCEISDETTVFDGQLKPGPWSGPPDGAPIDTVLVEMALSFKRQAKNTSYSITGEHCDDANYEVIQQNFHAAVTADKSAHIVTGSRIAFGLGAFGTRDTRIEMFTPIHIVPIVLWYEPLRTMNTFGIANNLWKTAGDSVVLPDGGSAIRLYAEWGAGGDASFRMVVTARNEPPYLPLEMVQSYDKRRQFAYEFQYSPQEKANDRLSAWTYQKFNDDGLLALSRKAKVLNFASGKTYSDKDFSLKFPVGAHVIEYTTDGEKFWLQASPNELKPMPASDYGRSPKSKIY